MIESRNGNATPHRRAVVLAVVAAVALTGVSAFVAGGSPTTTAGGAADWSPHPGKDVTPDNETVCPPANETSVENGTTPTNETGNATNASGYQLRIVYDGNWNGTITTEDEDIVISGSGEEIVDVAARDDELVSAFVSNDDFDSEERMAVQLLLDGEVVDQEKRLNLASVDNYELVLGDSSSVNTDIEANNTSLESTSDTGSLNQTGTANGWNTFGGENEASAFNKPPKDPFNDSNNTVTTSNDTFSNDTVTASNDTVATSNTTNKTSALNDTATSEECAPAENTTITTTNNSTNGSALSLSTNGSAQVVFADQNTATGTSVVVESATIPDSGFVVIHDMSLLQDGDFRGSMIGVSDKLDAQQSKDIEITLARGITESQTLIAVLYRDTDGDGEFEYDGTEGAADGPYLDDNGTAVADNAYVTVPGDGETAANTAGDNSTTANTQNAEPFGNETTTGTPATADSEANQALTETNAPGFGIGVAIVALLGAALLATRRF